MAVLGGGSAGLIAALVLRRTLPTLGVRVVRSPDLGIIGVGEGTTVPFTRCLFDYLGLPKTEFYTQTGATWKQGLRFLWGPRPVFYFPFADEPTIRAEGLERPLGFYAEDDLSLFGVASARMHVGKAFPRRLDGWPQIAGDFALHVENARLVAYLEEQCRAAGVEFVEGTMAHAEHGAESVRALVLQDGGRIEADLFVDASGFRAELIGRTLDEPFVSYERTLFCDRAVIGGWSRTDEPILPYTTCETMNAGWAWQIEHEGFINRGYVYCSRFLDDDAALGEFIRANPRIDPAKTRVVRFPSGRRRRAWIGNVVALGNAGGFVEPLEATALGTICLLAMELATLLRESQARPTPSYVEMWNRNAGEQWDDIRDFLAVHYAFNTRRDTPFWQTCRAEVDLAGAAPLVEFYRENGPLFSHQWFALRRNASFGLGAYLALLVGQRAPCVRWNPPEDERVRWRAFQAHWLAEAQQGCDVAECLRAVRNPVWWW